VGLERFGEHRNSLIIEPHQFRTDDVDRDRILTRQNHAAIERIGIHRTHTLSGDNPIDDTQTPLGRTLLKPARSVRIKQHTVDIKHHPPERIVAMPPAASDGVVTLPKYLAADPFGDAVDLWHDNWKAQ